MAAADLVTTAVPALELQGLRTVFPSDDGPLTLIDDVSLSVPAAQTLAVVGESGSGKTMTFLSALGLVPPPGLVVAGRVLLEGRDVARLSARELRALRGTTLAMIFQDPLTALNPVFTIGAQIMDVIRAHHAIGRAEARMRAIALLERVQIPDPERRVDDYPHQLSGGMRQRVLIAMAIALGPKILIADEPTTALDVTVQAQILELLAALQRESGMALVLITHDLGLVARYADHVAVMYAGRIVEAGPLDAIFGNVRHPYTRALFQSIPRLDAPPGRALPAIEGQPPRLAALPPGCAFEPRCVLGRGREDCRQRRPALSSTDDPRHASACHHWHALDDAASDPR
jgi:oligopeptide transport system ATP-binding protein